MADLNKRLLRTVDGPAPQQKVAGKNELEFVEGSDGAQHIKVVGKSGKVQDIGDRLESIENQQQEILERLDDPLDTQLIGSIVELYKSDSVEMESNSRINLIDITEMKKKHVIASIRARDSHDFLLNVDWRTSATGGVGYSVGAEQLIKSDNELSSKTENYISTKTNVARFRLENNSDEIQRYLSIVIMGVD